MGHEQKISLQDYCPIICHFKIKSEKCNQLSLLQTNVYLTSALPQQIGSCWEQIKYRPSTQGVGSPDV